MTSKARRQVDIHTQQANKTQARTTKQQAENHQQALAKGKTRRKKSRQTQTHRKQTKQYKHKHSNKQQRTNNTPPHTTNRSNQHQLTTSPLYLDNKLRQADQQGKSASRHTHTHTHSKQPRHKHTPSTTHSHTPPQHTRTTMVGTTGS